MICPISKSRIEKAVRDYHLWGVVPSQEPYVGYDGDGKAVVAYGKIPRRQAVRFGEGGRLSLAFMYKGEQKRIPV